jgi:integrase/predicted RNA-binding Zn-ribbon protein involved in translation (DUF1610 family)
MGTAEESGREKPYQVEDADVGNWANPQPPKSRPESPEKSLKHLRCPECGSERLFRDGLRRLADGSAAQRWLCRECGFRFSERRMGKPGGKDLKRGSALNLNRRVCAPEGGVENSASRELRLMENGQTAEKRAAGATENPKTSELLFNFAWWMKKQGYNDSTIETRVKILKVLVKSGADLNDPESVKEAIARQDWCNKRKVNAADAYSAFLRMMGRTWDPPKFRVEENLPFIPSEGELDALIAGSGLKTSTFLRLLKETGVRAGEAIRLRWSDIDFITGTVRITPEKGSKPRIFRISNELLNMLANVRARYGGERVFSKSLRTVRRLFQRQRARLAKKLQNPRLLQIHFHTFRHWKATMLYHQTKDILYVMNFLGHRNIKNTLLYVQLEDALFKGNDEYVCKAAGNADDAKTLIEVGFEYVCTTPDGIMLFRKRK